MAAKLPPHVIENLRRLKRDSTALVESVADRLPPESLGHLEAYSAAGEWTFLVESLCGTLVKRQIPIRAVERAALAAVLALFASPEPDHFRYVNDPDGTLAALNVVTP